ncbi:hypothetical protein [Actinacidiphila acidipaludis]|uniref:Uncharacterized protein n=1 Tax=Actinacidiphila acidipaludis TaxID=2873382 RepID=A0ABS7Q291_9ACTN|nr:hypothetical protein [Streptomyces acidipaludis]MBY8877251.1 hypothetical protein [Streptomyces acidipaludis]
MESTADARPQRRSPATAIAVTTLLAAILGLAFLLYAFATVPKPPPVGEISREQAQRNVETAANAYASALLKTARSGTVTGDRARAVPAPRGTTISAADVRSEGGTTVVTFLLHKGYGRPEAPQEVEVCYRLTLTGSSGVGAPPNWSFRREATSECHAA